MNTNFLPYLLLSTEQSSLPVMEDDGQLLDQLLKQQYLTVTDWKGEDEPYQVGDFLNARLAALKPGSVLEIKAVYEELAAATPEMSPGDGMEFLLNTFKGMLKKEGFVMVLLDKGNDSYYIGLTAEKNKKKLEQQSDEYWRWKAYGSRSGEVLYTVYCTCGCMNVWQVKQGEIITDGTCEDCDSIIFDSEGKSTLPVERDYI